jgi:GTPase Era involved in 16S rRNA processing
MAQETLIEENNLSINLSSGEHETSYNGGDTNELKTMGASPIPQSSADGSDVKIVFAGKSGAGKSTLKSNLFKCEEEVEMSPDQITLSCGTESYSKHGTRMKVTDTMGIQVGKGGKKEKLRELSDHTGGKADLLVYCIPVDPSSKFDDANPAIMQSLQDAYSKDIWKQCIIVFTFSNYAWDRNRKKNNNKEDALAKYKTHINNYAAKVTAELANLNVQNIKVKTIFDQDVEDGSGQATIVAIPAGDESDDEVTAELAYKPKYITTDSETTVKWTDVVFDEMMKKSKAEHKEKLLRYRYGTDKGRTIAKVAAGVISGATGGAFVGALGGGLLGIAGGPVGVGAGVVVGGITGSVATGVAGGAAVIEQVRK